MGWLCVLYGTLEADVMEYGMLVGLMSIVMFCCCWKRKKRENGDDLYPVSNLFEPRDHLLKNTPSNDMLPQESEESGSGKHQEWNPLQDPERRIGKKREPTTKNRPNLQFGKHKKAVIDDNSVSSCSRCKDKRQEIHRKQMAHHKPRRHEKYRNPEVERIGALDIERWNKAGTGQRRKSPEEMEKDRAVLYASAQLSQKLQHNLGLSPRDNTAVEIEGGVPAKFSASAFEQIDGNQQENIGRLTRKLPARAFATKHSRSRSKMIPLGDQLNKQVGNIQALQEQQRMDKETEEERRRGARRDPETERPSPTETSHSLQSQTYYSHTTSSLTS